MKLDFSSGKPSLALGLPHSAGAQVQAWLPGAQVVKAFNIISATRNHWTHGFSLLSARK